MPRKVPVILYAERLVSIVCGYLPYIAGSTSKLTDQPTDAEFVFDGNMSMLKRLDDSGDPNTAVLKHFHYKGPGQGWKVPFHDHISA